MSSFDEKLDDIDYAITTRVMKGEPGFEGTTIGMRLKLEAGAKQAIKQLIADEMRELIGEDTYGVTHITTPSNNIPVTHYDKAQNALRSELRTKLTEWIKESV